MVEIRLFEDKVQQLFQQGLIEGTTHLCQGQEAVCVGAMAALGDGQHVDAVRAAVHAAVARARADDGPSLLEMKTYRYRGHSRTDPAKYRAEGELERWKERDPIELLGATLALDEEARREVW